MMESQSFHPLDYLSVANRRKWWFIVPLVLCIAAGAALLAVWPKKYLSKAAIGVQSPTLSPELLRGLNSLDPVERQLFFDRRSLKAPWPVLEQFGLKLNSISPDGLMPAFHTSCICR